MRQSLCENSLSCVWGGLFSRQPASSRLFGVENKSRPEGGCRLIARPTYEPGAFTQTRQLGPIASMGISPKLTHRARMKLIGERVDLRWRPDVNRVPGEGRRRE